MLHKIMDIIKLIKKNHGHHLKMSAFHIEKCASDIMRSRGPRRGREDGSMLSGLV